ncbi:PIG-L deacetylase family protein [Amycolatopsis magusensis]|uniref:PIG-L deacetylase family protein n=1 Tax=Amycolatopsis magusensis TaxID=882444 RepID=UPI003C2E3055
MSKPVALAVFAHPDDAELACFGTFAALRARGYALSVLSLTDGANSDVEQSYLRPKEARLAAAVLGSELVVEDFEDGSLTAGRALFDRIEQHIRRVRPSIVLTHYPGPREHQDHQVVGTVATTVAHRAGHVDLVLQGEPPGLADSFAPQLFTDITAHIDVKLKALACYKSEADKGFMHRETVLDRARWWARQAGAVENGTPRYYEAFVVSKALLPVLTGV